MGHILFLWGRCAVGGSKKTSGSLDTEQFSGNSVPHDGSAGDQDQIDSRVIAVDHSRHTGVLGDRSLGVVIESFIETVRIDYDDVGSVSDAQMTGVDLIPVGELPGKPMHCPLGGHERLTAPFRIAHVAQ
jgi:hypothetical protein